MPISKTKPGQIRPYRAIPFFTLALSIAWSSWWIIAGFGWHIQTVPAQIGVAIGGLSPTLAALILLYRFHNRAQQKDYWIRAFDWSRIGWRHYLFLLLFIPALVIASVAISIAFGGNWSQLQLIEDYQQQPLSLIPFALFVLILGPVPEELGWRGYALDALTGRVGALWASIALAIGWAVWHIPLFFINGYPLAEMNFGAAEFAVYFGSFIPKSILYTALFYAAGRSTLTAILFHFVINFTGMIVEINFQTEIIQMMLYWLVAFISIILFRQLFFSKQ